MLHMTTGRASTRYIAVAIAVILLVLYYSVQRGHIPTPARFRTQAHSTCSDDVRSSLRLDPPWGVEPQRMRAIWQELLALFREAQPVPDYLDRPYRAPGTDPILWEMREQVIISEEDGAKTRAVHDKLLSKLPEYPEDLFIGGKGVVTLAGGRYSEFAATSLGMLRELGSRLPVEVWVVDDREEMQGWCVELAAEGMGCRRLSDYVDTGSIESAYQYKVFTMLFSVFEEIIFLDADSIPLRNTDELFQSEAYQEFGAILWPDYWMSIASPHTPYLIGVSNNWTDHRWYDSGTVESGQIMWNKRRHWKSLLVATYYNFHGPSFWYTLFSGNFAGWGDKETFPHSLYATNESFYHIDQDKRGISTVFMTPNSRVDPLHGIGMLQADPRNHTSHNSLFLHCNIIKWSMRDFFCDGCRDAWASDDDKYLGVPPMWKGRFENPDDDAYENLHQNLRIFNKDAFTKDGLDPEPLLWKVLEHTACRSKAWGSEQVCGHVRRYMRNTFHFRFTEPGGALSKVSESSDAWDLATSPDLCVIHPTGWQYFDKSLRGW